MLWCSFFYALVRRSVTIWVTETVCIALAGRANGSIGLSHDLNVLYAV